MGAWPIHSPGLRCPRGASTREQMNHHQMPGVPRNDSDDVIRHAYLGKESQLRAGRCDGAPTEVLTAVSKAQAMLEEAYVAH